MNVYPFTGWSAKLPFKSSLLGRQRVAFSDTNTDEVTIWGSWFFGSAPAAVSAALGTTEAADTVAITGSLAIMAALAATDTADTVAISVTIATAGISAALATTEASDTTSIVGSLSVRLTLGFTEPADTTALSVTVANRIQLATTDAADIAAMAVTLQALPSAALAVTEARDTTALAVLMGVSTQLAVTEPSDTVAITLAAAAFNSSFALVENPDAVGFAWIMSYADFKALAVAPRTRKLVLLGPRGDAVALRPLSRMVYVPPIKP